MLALLRQPLNSVQLTLAAAAIAIAVAVYCVVYSALAGRPETFVESVLWSVVNVMPWVPAIEGAKRAPSLFLAALALFGGLAASIGLGFAFTGTVDGAAFELWRRVPTLILVTGVAVAIRWSSRKHRTNDNDELPLLPRQIEWVRAAGNYVELRGCGRTIVHRSPLSAIERQLAGHGFVRIHRSMLVRRECIARIRSEDLVLADGTHLRIGKRYRAALAA